MRHASTWPQRMTVAAYRPPAALVDEEEEEEHEEQEDEEEHDEEREQEDEGTAMEHGDVTAYMNWANFAHSAETF